MILSATPNSNPMYEVVIGAVDNTKSQIFRPRDLGRNQPLAESQTPGILNCHDFRKFWISWQEDEILVGIYN